MQKDVKVRRSARYVWYSYKWSYFFMLPGAVLIFLFAYVPMYGVIIAFKEFDIVKGITGSPWNGLDNFSFFTNPYFWMTFKNTIAITLYKMAVTFPVPILVAILLNEVRHMRFRKTIQSFIYLPHFISWIVVAYMINSLLALETGGVNNFLTFLGFEQIHFMGKPQYFRTIVVLSSLWKGTGWGTIIYLAALSNVDPQLYEAATIDGAGRTRRIWHIDIPGILPTIVIILILSMPGLLNANFDQIMPLMNPANQSVAEVLDTFLVRLGLAESQFNKAAAIGFSLSVFNLILVFGTNYICKKLSEESLW